MINQQDTKICTWINEFCVAHPEQKDKFEKRCTSIGVKSHGKLAETACRKARISAKLCKWEAGECLTSGESSLTGLNGSGLMIGSSDEYTLKDYMELLEKHKPRDCVDDTKCGKGQECLHGQCIQKRMILNESPEEFARKQKASLKEEKEAEDEHKTAFENLPGNVYNSLLKEHKFLGTE